MITPESGSSECIILTQTYGNNSKCECSNYMSAEFALFAKTTLLP